MNKCDWIKSVIEHSEVEGVQLTQLKGKETQSFFTFNSDKKSKQWFEKIEKTVGGRLENREMWSKPESVIIECWRSLDSLGGLILLDVNWCKSSMLLHLQLNALFVSPRSKQYMMNTLKSLGYGFGVIFNDLDADSLTPVVIIDVADHIQDALLWRDVLAEEFEDAQSEGDLILVSRGGDLVQGIR